MAYAVAYVLLSEHEKMPQAPAACESEARAQERGRDFSYLQGVTQHNTQLNAISERTEGGGCLCFLIVVELGIVLGGFLEIGAKQNSRANACQSHSQRHAFANVCALARAFANY